MSDIVVRRNFALSRVERQVQLLLAAEDGKADAVDRKISQGYRITVRKSLRHAQLHQLNSMLSYDCPQLEAQLRQSQQIIGMATDMLIADYLTR